VTIEEPGEARYSVGGGVTWDSTAESEYAECFAKAELLNRGNGDFSLLESVYYDGEFYLLDRHLARLEASARYFGFPLQADRIKADLHSRAKAWPVSTRSPLKVRLLLARSGAVHVEANDAAPSGAIFLGYARDAVDTKNLFLYHKTTRRDMYDTALCTRPDCDDVLLWNERDEVTESARANIVLDIDGERVTPPVSSGLLAGVMRAEMLEQGLIREAVVTKSDLERATGIWLINSIRKWMPVVWRG
jgi:para-aminobenzoate synthetase / 4-amino-4-deoxychorismate lyase